MGQCFAGFNLPSSFEEINQDFGLLAAEDSLEGEVGFDI